MTMRVIHHAEDRIDLRGDGFGDRCYIICTTAGWWLHLEPAGKAVFDRRGLSSQELLDTLHQVVESHTPGQFVHWADVWLYMRVSDHRIGRHELEDCKINTQITPPKLLFPVQTLPFGTRIRILQLVDERDDRVVGVTGRVVKPVPVLMGSKPILAGLEIDPEFRPILGESINLVPGDKYEVIKE